MFDERALVAFTQELVRAVGVSGEEQSAAQCVEAEMRRLGYDHVEVDALGNVVGVITGTGNGPTILLTSVTMIAVPYRMIPISNRDAPHPGWPPLASR